MASIVEVAFIIKNQKYSESDRIYTLFGKKIGKFTAIGKGAQKPSVKKTGKLETGAIAKLRLAEGRSMYTIVETEEYLNRSDKPNRYKFLLLASELVNRYSHEYDPNKNIFNALYELCKNIQKSTNLYRLINLFHMKIMKESGYLPDFLRCSITSRDISTQTQAYISPSGPVIGDYDSPEEKWPKVNSKYFIILEKYDHIAGKKLPEKVETDIFKILNYLTELHLDRRLISKKLFS